MKKRNSEKPEDFYATRLEFAKNQPSPSTLYPHYFEETITIPNLLKNFSHLTNDQSSESTYSLCGRLMSKRGHGKLFFYDLASYGSKIQLLCSKTSFSKPTSLNELNELDLKETENYNSSFEKLHSSLHRGDIIGVKGKPYRSKRGELSVMVSEITILAPCLRPLPTSYYSLKDQELRFRNRPLDLIMNSEVRETFICRSKTISFLRNELLKKNFLEVETPILSKIAAGAAAKPFKTVLNELKMPLFMRIAPELYLKRLIIGGFERVFEFGKNFRNEGIDATHNPEFTSLELYWAYKDYRDGMKLVEEMLSGLVYSLFGSFKVKFSSKLDENNKEEVEDVKEIDFTPPFRRVCYLEAIEEKGGFKMPANLETEDARQFLLQKLNEHKLKVPSPPTVAKILDRFAGKFIEEEAFNPTFVLEHPQIMSPLAKFHRSKVNVTERFELFVNGFEVANAYTELNNPIVQRETFNEQAKQRAEGDEEVPPADEEFCRDMELGLPPTCGIGIGIDRLVMLLTGKKIIKEVILFPLLKDN